MKLGLLLVLAVAAVVASLSESRTFSKCELKEKLEKAIQLPDRLQKHKTKIVSIVICELYRRSCLNSNLIREYGKRKFRVASLRPELNMTSEDSDGSGDDSSDDSSAGSDETFDDLNIDEIDLFGSDDGSDSDSDDEDSSSEDDTSEDDTSEDDTSEDESSGDDSSEDESSENDSSLDNWKGRRGKKFWWRWWLKWLKRYRRRKFFNRRVTFYGLFQLPDSHFCDSGRPKSRNLCNKNCKAFANNDISDDIACFVKHRCWLAILRRASPFCCRRRNYKIDCDKKDDKID